jgi:hypothetical protein
MMDDLRDYRFYKGDLLHPTEIAVDYIWNIFQNTFFNQEQIEIIKKVEKIKNMENHRAIFPNSNKTKEFHNNLALEKINFFNTFPHINW